MGKHAARSTASPSSTPTVPAPRGRWWILPLLIYVVSRVIGGVLFANMGYDMPAFSAVTGAHMEVQVPANPGYPLVLTLWDGQWYWTIAQHGYPVTLPHSADGSVAQNPWVFYPVYPGLVRLAMTATGMSFPWAASTVSMLAGAVAILLLYRLLRPLAGEFNTLLAIAAFCASPAAVLLQAAYAESVTLVLLILVLLLLRSRRYGWLTATILVLSITRPLVLPLSLVIAWHWWIRWRARGSDPFPRREQVKVGAITVMTAASFGLWPLIAGIVTRVPNAFLLTHSAWTTSDQTSGLLPSWFFFSWNNPIWWGVLITGVFLVLIAGNLVPSSRYWGIELRSWGLAYSTYLFTAARPTSSIIRYAILLLVWWPLPFKPRRRIHPALRFLMIVAILSAGAIAQYYWIKYVWVASYNPNPWFHTGCCVP